MELTLKGLAKLDRTPAPRTPLHRTQFGGTEDDPRGLSVLVFEPDLLTLEAKLREADLLLHKARLKVRSLLKKQHETGHTMTQLSDQQRLITGQRHRSIKRKVPFVSNEKWKRFKAPEKALVRAMYAYQPRMQLRSKCLGLMKIVGLIGGGYFSDLLKVKVLADSRFSPTTILYKARL
jgi:hypothetical protein